MANTFFKRHLDLHHTCHKEAADQYQILSALVPSIQLLMSLPIKKGPFQPQFHSPLRATPEALTIKAADEGNHLRFPKPVLPFKQSLSRLYGYHFYLNNNTKG